jgi:hypothetical protein
MDTSDTRLSPSDREHLLRELRCFASDLGTGPVSLDDHWETIRTLLKHEDPPDAAEAAAVIAVRGWYHWLMSRTCVPGLQLRVEGKLRSAVGSISVCCYGMRLRSWVHHQGDASSASGRICACGCIVDVGHLHLDLCFGLSCSRPRCWR